MKCVCVEKVADEEEDDDDDDDELDRDYVWCNHVIQKRKAVFQSLWIVVLLSVIMNDLMAICCGAAPEKKKRGPTAYNRFIKYEIKRLKAEHPNITHKEAFSAAAKNVSFFFWLGNFNCGLIITVVISLHMLKLCSGHIAHKESIEMDKSVLVKKETQITMVMQSIAHHEVITVIYQYKIL